MHNSEPTAALDPKSLSDQYPEHELSIPTQNTKPKPAKLLSRYIQERIEISFLPDLRGGG